MLTSTLILTGCTGDPARVTALPPSCPGSDDPAYVYTVADDAAVNILGVRPDGAVLELTRDGGSSHPSYTPDGRSIVFSRADPGRPGASSPPSADSVWIMADGSDPRELLRMTVVDSASVSPDGSRVAVIGQQRSDRPDRGVYVANIDGSGLRRLYALPSRGQLLFGDLPAWSPDGTEVAVVITANGRFAIYAISTDDGSWREVTEAETFSQPAWSADGATISFLSRVPQRGEDPYGVFTVPAAGGEPRRVRPGADVSPNAEALTAAASDGSAWLVQRRRLDRDQSGHELALVDGEGDVDRVALPGLDVAHVGSAALAPCALG